MPRAARKLACPGLGLVLSTLLACTAEIDGRAGQTAGGAGGLGAGAAGSSQAGAGAGVDPGSTPCDPNPGFAPPRLWRLNDQQYQNGGPDAVGAGIALAL